ncbi:MAG: hypothetical protein KDD38_10795 [Bdellovibrionales bacterium]|nr:hypothetical protein [Bdellovibrionales bacterium]
MYKPIKYVLLFFVFLSGLNLSHGALDDSQVNEVLLSSILEFNAEISQLPAPFLYRYNPAMIGGGFGASSAELTIEVTTDQSTYKRSPYYLLSLTGRFAKHERMTEDALAMLICHEIGHAIGGSPTLKRTHVDFNLPISVEGQADYFAARDCFNRVAKRILVQEEMNYPDSIRAVCEANADPGGHSIDECIRIIGAGYQLQSVVVSIRNSFSNGAGELFPDPIKKASTSLVDITKETFEGHPEAQCRMDTYVAGALNKPRPGCWYYNPSTQPHPPSSAPRVQPQ